MPPKRTNATVRPVLAKGSRRPTVQSFAATSSGSRGEVKLKRIGKATSSQAETGEAVQEGLLTLQRAELEEQEFENSIAVNYVSTQAAYEVDDAELLENVTEEPEDLTTPVNTSPGKVTLNLS